MIWAAWLSTVTLAGSGPWVVGEGRATVYAGAEVQRLNNLAVTVADERSVVEVGEGLSTVGFKGIVTMGLSSRFDLQATVPWYRVQANRDDAQVCVDLGLNACATTQGVGILQMRGKALALDEFFGAPFSLAIGAELRIGDFTAAERERITNLGEGTTDAGPFLVVGRTGSLGKGFYSAWLEGQFRYRAPNTNSYAGQGGAKAVPASEILGGTELIVGPTTRMALGLSGFLLSRPGGYDWGELDFTDPDRFGALSVFSARVGGVAVVRARSNVAASLSVLRTVAAVNNPTDTWNVSLGLQLDTKLPGAGDG